MGFYSLSFKPFYENKIYSWSPRWSLSCRVRLFQGRHSQRRRGRLIWTSIWVLEKTPNRRYRPAGRKLLKIVVVQLTRHGWWTDSLAPEGRGVQGGCCNIPKMSEGVQSWQKTLRTQYLVDRDDCLYFMTCHPQNRNHWTRGHAPPLVNSSRPRVTADS